MQSRRQALIRALHQAEEVVLFLQGEVAATVALPPKRGIARAEIAKALVTLVNKTIDDGEDPDELIQQIEKTYDFETLELYGSLMRAQYAE